MSKSSKFHKTVCFYFQVHQPYRLINYNFFENDDDYFRGPENATNKDIFEKVAQKCYIPTTALLFKLIQKHPELRFSFSFSGVFLEQCLEFGETGKKVLNLFQKLVQTGQVEVLSETYYHSLSFLYSKLDYAEQIIKHRKLIKKLFNVETKVFRNTELIYHNEIANFIRAMGFSGMLLEGWDHTLGWKKQHYLMEPVKKDLHREDQKIALKYSLISHRESAFKTSSRDEQRFGLLLKDYRLSDDIAFRFGNKAWEEFPLTTQKFVHWLDILQGDTINLFMDYETFGEHQWESTGIFKFLETLPEALLAKNIGFKTPSETLQNYKIQGTVDCPNYLSWADSERDLSAWVGNSLQDSALQTVASLEKLIHPLRNSRKKEDKILVDEWGKLQTSDHFYYMCLKYWKDGDVHKYFSPYESPYEAYISFMNVCVVLKQKIIYTLEKKNSQKSFVVSPYSTSLNKFSYA